MACCRAAIRAGRLCLLMTRRSKCAAENSLQNLRVRRGPSLGRHNNCWALAHPGAELEKIRPESPALLSQRRGAECFVKMLNSQRPQAGNRPCLA